MCQPISAQLNSCPMTGQRLWSNTLGQSHCHPLPVGLCVDGGAYSSLDHFQVDLSFCFPLDTTASPLCICSALGLARSAHTAWVLFVVCYTRKQPHLRTCLLQPWLQPQDNRANDHLQSAATRILCSRVMSIVQHSKSNEPPLTAGASCPSWTIVLSAPRTSMTTKLEERWVQAREGSTDS